MRRRTATLALVAALLAVPASAALAQAPGSMKPIKTDRIRQAEANDRAARQALRNVLPEVRLDNVPLAEAMDFLRDVTGVNLHVNWRALEEVNVTRETTVNVRLQQVPLRKLLRIILDEVSPENLLTFYTDDGVIEVTTRAVADRKMITRVYDIEDIILEVPNFDDPPQIELNQQSQVSGGGGGGGGGNLLGGGGGTGSGTRDEQQTTKQERGEQIVALVMDTIQPDIWRANGGTASVRYWRGKLIVTAPRSVHEQLGG